MTRTTSRFPMPMSVLVVLVLATLAGSAPGIAFCSAPSSSSRPRGLPAR